MQKLKKRQSGLTIDVMLKGLNVPPTPLHWPLVVPIRLVVMNRDATAVCREGCNTGVSVCTCCFSVSLCECCMFMWFTHTHTRINNEYILQIRIQNAFLILLHSETKTLITSLDYRELVTYIVPVEEVSFFMVILQVSYKPKSRRS